MSGHFLNSKKCINCGHGWWEFDRCCSNPSIAINPHEVARYGNEGPWDKPQEKIDNAISAMEQALKTLKEAR